METILTLAEAGRYPVQQVGGKAHNLGRLILVGFDVPPGFVVLPGADAQAIVSLLNDGLWAVRSSAAAEDSAEFSFAGQHESFLNILPQDVPEKVAACRVSGERQAARAYRQGQRASGIAVIVQKMITAEVAGAAFTVDPVSGDAQTLVVEMIAGSGEALMAGVVAPHSLHLPRRGEAFEIPPGCLLTPERGRELRRLLLAVESALGAPQDIEWCSADDRFWLLQSRPITTIRSQWTRANIGEVMPGVVTPLTWSVFRRHLTGKAEGDPNLIRLIDGRAHLLRKAVDASFRWLVWADHLAVGRALGLEVEQDALHPRRGLLSWLASLLFLFDALNLTGRLDRRVRQFTRRPVPGRTDIASLDLPTLLARLGTWDDWTRQAFRLHLYTTTYAIGAFGILMRLKGRRTPAELERDLLNTWQASRSAEIGQALRSLARQAEQARLQTLLQDAAAASDLSRLSSTTPGSAWLEAWHAFFEQFGDRTTAEFELSTPRWSETPDLILELVKRELRLSGSDEPGRLLSSDSSAAMPGRLFNRFSLGYARFVSLRETMKHEVIRGYGALRQLYLAIGQRFFELGGLEQVEDIFFLTDEEIHLAAGQWLPELGETIQLRRRQWQRCQVIGGAASVSERAAIGTLKGIGCSRGIAEGKARVVMTLFEGLSLQPDEILVVPHADPAWTPLILGAAAVAADLGGYLSHTATVAREFGIPAVFNLKNVSQLVRTGQMLRVDGEAGTVEILE